MGYREDAAKRLGKKTAVEKEPKEVKEIETHQVDIEAIQKFLQDFDFEDSVTMSQNLSMLALQNHLMQVVSMQSTGLIPFDAIKLLTTLTATADKLNGLKMHIDTTAAIKSLESQGYVILRSPTPKLINPMESQASKIDQPG